MYKWFADDTECRTDKKFDKPNVFIFGGIIINSKEEKKLRNLIKSVKSDYTIPDLPVKWNFKDLRETYKKFHKFDDYQKLLENSYEWRREIFEKSLDIDYRVSISMLENFQYEKKNLKKIKGDLNCILFSNSLMRLGLFAGRKNIEEFEIILDWPEKGDPTPFNHEYYYAFNRGFSSKGIEFLSGPLVNHGFHESVLFSKMTHSNSLQFADLVIGAFKDFCESHFFEIENSLGKDLTELILKEKFDSYNSEIVGVGINIPSNNAKLRKRIKKIVG